MSLEAITTIGKGRSGRQACLQVAVCWREGKSGVKAIQQAWEKVPTAEGRGGERLENDERDASTKKFYEDDIGMERERNRREGHVLVAPPTALPTELLPCQ